MTRNFPLTTLYIGAGLVIWTGNFLLTYVFTAVACARGFASITFAGVGIVPLVVVSSTVLALAAAAWVAFRALSGYRARCDAEGKPDTECFIHFTAAGVASLSMVAITWTGFVAAVSSSCR